MSIILKALKKAESASGKQGIPPVRASMSGEKRWWPLVLVAVCTVALGFFFATYLFMRTAPTAAPAPVTKTTPPITSAKTDAVSVVGSSTINTDAVAQIRAGKHEEAESLLRNAIKQYPNDPYLHNHLGLALKKQGKLTEAALEYEKAIELKPDYFIAMNNLAVTLEALGNKKRAMELYAKATEGDPTISGAHLNYALLLEAEGKISEAEGHYHT
ncbi:MAG: tetratricopeptide repeat protein, partial [Armatimonadetes bacterium]|nr:tetratricopeptide repeat protein [Armatimonadota bacterium]